MRLSTASAHLYHSNASKSLNGIIMYMYLKLLILKSKKKQEAEGPESGQGTKRPDCGNK